MVFEITIALIFYHAKYIEMILQGNTGIAVHHFFSEKGRRQM
jgi:hypothetical protein